MCLGSRVFEDSRRTTGEVLCLRKSNSCLWMLDYVWTQYFFSICSMSQLRINQKHFTSSIWESLQYATTSEIGCSQVKRQEHALTREGHLCMEHLLFCRVPQNMKYTNHQYMTKILQFSPKKLGTSARHSTLSMEALKNTCVDLEMFILSKMKAVVHFGPNYLANSEVGKLTNFEEIESFFQYHSEVVVGRF